jgi:hypothetical protein
VRIVRGLLAVVCVWCALALIVSYPDLALPVGMGLVLMAITVGAFMVGFGFGE